MVQIPQFEDRSEEFPQLLNEFWLNEDYADIYAQKQKISREQKRCDT